MKVEVYFEDATNVMSEYWHSVTLLEGYLVWGTVIGAGATQSHMGPAHHSLPLLSSCSSWGSRPSSGAPQQSRRVCPSVIGFQNTLICLRFVASVRVVWLRRATVNKKVIMQTNKVKKTEMENLKIDCRSWLQNSLMSCSRQLNYSFLLLSFNR